MFIPIGSTPWMLKAGFFATSTRINCIQIGVSAFTQVETILLFPYLYRIWVLSTLLEGNTRRWLTLSAAFKINNHDGQSHIPIIKKHCNWQYIWEKYKRIKTCDKIPHVGKMSFKPQLYPLSPSFVCPFPSGNIAG